MTENVENMTLELLRSIRGDVHEIKTAQSTLIRRMDTLQSEMALVHRKFADMAMELTQVVSRLDRIERRLDLVDTH